ncbi:FecR domain-containing protein [uncultured Muribaculum sp.]|uniref:FecR domain-containing protein n=1 Tax=uncultured Muribaculum sp. TaxID=1918613 RepID=UPI0025FD4D31|nr:FecR domain-containing protein [uncultured Muribaculum sp.]
MPHTITDYDKIVGYLAAMPDMDADERARIESWILDHGDERGLSESLARLWASRDVSSSYVNIDGLMRLLNSIESGGGAPVSPAKVRRREMVWRVIAAASVLIAVLLGGLHLSRYGGMERETMLVTAHGSTGEFTLPDGSRVWLNGNTTLAYNPDFTSGDRRMVKVEGEAYFEVTRDTAHPFIVDMSEMEVEVKGTSFEVRNYATCNIHDVVLRSGCVNVRGPWGDGEVTLKPDEMLSLTLGTNEMSMRKVDASNYCRWFEQHSTFDNAPLGDILVNISRRYGMDLAVDPDVDTAFRLSVTLGGETLESLMNALAYLSPIAYETTGNTLHISAD